MKLHDFMKPNDFARKAIFVAVVASVGFALPAAAGLSIPAPLPIQLASLVPETAPATPIPPGALHAGGTQVASCWCQEFKRVCVGWAKNICIEWLNECIRKYCD